MKKTGAGPPPLFWLLTPISLYPQTLTSIISVSCFWTRRHRDDTPNSVVDSHSFLEVNSQFIIVNGKSVGVGFCFDAACTLWVPRCF